MIHFVDDLRLSLLTFTTHIAHILIPGPFLQRWLFLRLFERASRMG